MFLSRKSIGFLILACCGTVYSVFHGVFYNEPDAPVRTFTVARQVPYEGSERMIAALIPMKNEAWAFKLTAPVKEVDRVEADVLDFLKTVTFVKEGEEVKTEDGESVPPGTPQWIAPSAWFEREGNTFRHKTLLIPAEPTPLELSVSKISLPAREQQEFLLANVNRWRGQLGQDPVEMSALSEKDAKIRIANVSSVWVDITGKAGKGGMAGGGGSVSKPPTGPLPPNHPPVAGGGATPRDSAVPFAYAVPDSWKEAPPAAFRTAGFIAGTETLITINSLGGGGTLADNVNRWRGQVGLDPLPESQIADEVENLTLDGQPATWSESVGSDESGETIVAVTIPDKENGKTYFIKLRGPSEEAAAHLDEFRAFVDSISFPSAATETDEKPESDSPDSESPDSESPDTETTEPEAAEPDQPESEEENTSPPELPESEPESTTGSDAENS